MPAYKYLTTNNLSITAIWAWAKQLVTDLNAQASNTGQVVPSGAMMVWGGATAPDGWLLCDGSSYAETAYKGLFHAIGVTYGGGGGTFKVPDCRDRSLIGAGTVAALGAVAGASEVTLTEANLPAHAHDVTDPGHTHAFTGVAHTHAITDPGHSHTGGAAATATVGGAGAVADVVAQAATGSATTGITVTAATATGSNATAQTGITTENTGGGAAFSTLNPVIGVNVIIKT